MHLLNDTINGLRAMLHFYHIWIIACHLLLLSCQSDLIVWHAAAILLLFVQVMLFDASQLTCITCELAIVKLLNALDDCLLSLFVAAHQAKERTTLLPLHEAPALCCECVGAGGAGASYERQQQPH